MTKTILAIFENGVLRPLQPLVGVPDHAETDVTVSTRPRREMENSATFRRVQGPFLMPMQRTCSGSLPMSLTS